MDLSLTPEQESLRELVRTFAEREIAPNVAEWDDHREFPAHLLRRLGDLGVLGTDFSEDVGGVGLGTIALAVVVEEIGYGSVGFGSSLLAHIGLGSKPIELLGTDEQKERYLRPALAGKALSAFALTEPAAGSDAAGIKTRAVQQDGGWVLSGRKTFITNGSVADHLIVAASTDPELGARGITLFIVERGTPGFTAAGQQRKMGQHLSDTAELVFDECILPPQQQLGPRGEGFRALMQTLDHGRIGVAALVLGAARAALEQAIQHAKGRVAFGQPIAKFQAVQHKVADMATQLEVGRWITYAAAWRAQQGLPFTKEAAMAKLWTTEMAWRVVDEALQIHGGSGYMDGVPIERIYRDVRLFRITEGSSEIQRNIIAKQLGL